MNANTVTTGEARLSYVNVFEPQSRPGQAEAKYSVIVLIPKTDAATKAAIDAAIALPGSSTARAWNRRPR